MDKPLFVTVVCTGNICRSPMGAALLAHALAAEEPPLNQIQVMSAGMSAYLGDPASEHSIRAMEKVGLDLRPHRSRRFSPEILQQSLLVLAMTEGHRRMIRQLYGNDGPPVLLFRELMGGSQQEQDVPDPYGADLPYYLETRDSLAEAVPAIVAYLKEQLAKPEAIRQK